MSITVHMFFGWYPSQEHWLLAVYKHGRIASCHVFLVGEMMVQLKLRSRIFGVKPTWDHHFQPWVSISHTGASHIKGVLDKTTKLIQGRLYSFKRVLHVCNILQYTICSNDVSLPCDLKMQIRQITIRYKGRAPYIQGCYSKHMVPCLDKYHILCI